MDCVAIFSHVKAPPPSLSLSLSLSLSPPLLCVLACVFLSHLLLRKRVRRPSPGLPGTWAGPRVNVLGTSEKHRGGPSCRSHRRRASSNGSATAATTASLRSRRRRRSRRRSRRQSTVDSLSPAFPEPSREHSLEVVADARQHEPAPSFPSVDLKHTSEKLPVS